MPHLTIEQHENIYALKQQDYSQSYIAKKIICNQSTVSRELTKNKAGPKLGYLPDRAHKKSCERRN